jgi:hypothetical protein
MVKILKLLMVCFGVVGEEKELLCEGSFERPGALEEVRWP